MRINKDCWLLKTPIAHRGLWNETILENSITAYKNAVERGFPIEIDLYSSKDGVLYSFHDSELLRMTAENGFIYDKTSTELDGYRLKGSKEIIPRLSDVLELVDGKVPLLIEIKNQPRKDVVKMVVDALKEYKGEYAVQSFNPLYLNELRKIAPNIIRGVLSTKDVKGESLPVRLIIKGMLLNFLIKPDFISYQFTALPLKKRKEKNIPVICWTLTSEKDWEHSKPFAKNFIFENFIPKK